MDELERERRLIEEAKAAHKALHRTLRKKTPSFLQKVRAEGMRLEYDPEANILYVYPVSLGPVSASTEPLAENIYVRLAWDSEDIVGLEVLGLRENLKKLDLARAAFEQALPALASGEPLVIAPNVAITPVTAEGIERLFNAAA
jgi:uncharacterized protein YuzE